MDCTVHGGHKELDMTEQLSLSLLSRVTVYNLDYSFPYLEPVCCSLFSSCFCFLTCIQISQKADKMVWYSNHKIEGHGIPFHYFMTNTWINNENSDKLYFPRLQNHWRYWLWLWKKRLWSLEDKAMKNLDSILKRRDIALTAKVCIVKAMVLPEVMVDVRVGPWRKLSTKALMLLSCGVRQDSWESLGLQGDPTSPPLRK